MPKRSATSLARDRRRCLVAAGGKQVGEERLEDGEPLGNDRPGEAVERDGRRLDGNRRPLRLRRVALVALQDEPQSVVDGGDELSRRDRPGLALLPEHP